jgi:DNA polymerase-3 subunit alpha
VTLPISKLAAKVVECEEKKQPQKRVSVAGFITDVKVLTTKAGKPYSKTLIDDFDGSYELALFGRDHEAFMNYMQLHSSIFLEGEIAEKYFIRPEERRPGQSVPYAFKLKKVMLLGNVTETYLGGISLHLETPQLTAEFRLKLLDLVRKHRGNIPLTLYLFDPETRYKIEFLSKKFQVAVTSELIAELNLLGIQYKIARK